MLIEVYIVVNVVADSRGMTKAKLKIKYPKIFKKIKLRVILASFRFSTSKRIIIIKTY